MAQPIVRFTDVTKRYGNLTVLNKLNLDVAPGEKVAIIGEKRPGTVIIPPPLWHGAATVGDSPAGLFYYVTHGYDPKKPDEERRAFDSVAGFPWAVQHK